MVSASRAAASFSSPAVPITRCMAAMGGQQLIENPDLANHPDIAARLLASFLKTHEARIRAALTEGNLREARRLVNGGVHGLDAFTAAYNTGLALIPDPPTEPRA